MDFTNFINIYFELYVNLFNSKAVLQLQSCTLQIYIQHLSVLNKITQIYIKQKDACFT